MKEIIIFSVLMGGILFVGNCIIEAIKKGLDMPDKETYRIINHTYICKEEWRKNRVTVFVWSKRYGCFKQVLEGDTFENIEKIIGMG
jgi:hypothetical protein